MAAEVSTIHTLGPTTVEGWLAEEPPSDGSRLELILGYLCMSPAPTLPHQHAAFRLATMLDQAITAAGREDLHVLPAVAVKLSTAIRTGVVPDVAVVAAAIEGRTSIEPAELQLAVEVWSPGNKRAERETKMAGYAVAGVPFLWIVELPKGKPAKFFGYRLVESSYRQEVCVSAGETVYPPAPVRVEVSTARLR
ncbi:Uma2 family endonuclease [Nocardia sp. NPDC004722]